MKAVYIRVNAGVRYWEDGTVNGVETGTVDNTPFACKGIASDSWSPLINIETGVISDWPVGTTLDAHYKVCDAFVCHVVDHERMILHTYSGYVPDFMCPNGGGYGDYIIMQIDENGQIKDWKKPDIRIETKVTVLLDGEEWEDS